MTRIHHVSVGVIDVSRARLFYDPVMTLLGLRLIKFDADALHYGAEQILFSAQRPVDGGTARAGHGVHIAFSVADRATVDAFHREALRLGARDGGAPGIRPQYSEDYYAAFVFDPDGNKIEVVIEH